MKRLFFMMLCVTIVACFTCCGKRNPESVSNEDVENNKYVAKAIQKERCSIKENVKPYILKAGDEEYELKYMKSTYGPYNNDIIDEYLYIVDEGIVKERKGDIGVWINSSSDELVEISVSNMEFPFWEQQLTFETEEEIVKEVENIAEKYIDTEEYVFDYSLIAGTYYFKYHRMVEGCISEDAMFINFTEEMGMISIFYNKLGEYKDVTLGEFDKEKGEQAALEKMKELWGEDEYKVTKTVVSTVDEKLGVVYYCGNDGMVGEKIFVWLE